MVMSAMYVQQNYHAVPGDQPKARAKARQTNEMRPLVGHRGIQKIIAIVTAFM